MKVDLLRRDDYVIVDDSRNHGEHRRVRYQHYPVPHADLPEDCWNYLIFHTPDNISRSRWLPDCGVLWGQEEGKERNAACTIRWSNNSHVLKPTGLC